MFDLKLCQLNNSTTHNMLAFGKYKGEPISNIPIPYVWWLTCWKLDNEKVVSIWANYSGATWREKIDDFLLNAPAYTQRH